MGMQSRASTAIRIQLPCPRWGWHPNLSLQQHLSPVTSPNSELTGVVLGEEAGEVQIKELMSDVKQTGPQRQDYLPFPE